RRARGLPRAGARHRRRTVPRPWPRAGGRVRLRGITRGVRGDGVPRPPGEPDPARGDLPAHRPAGRGELRHGARRLRRPRRAHRDGDDAGRAAARGQDGDVVNGLEVRDVVVTYPGGTTAVGGVTLDVPTGEVLALLGPSGCGK